MCWSKRSSADEDSRSTTTQKGMDPKNTCWEGTNECEKTLHFDFCSGHGLCCINPKFDTTDDHYMSCKCKEDRGGRFCEYSKYWESRKNYERTEVIVAFSAVLGVIVIALFIALIVLQAKYYRRRRKRRRQMAGDDHELDRISKPDGFNKGSRKLLISQPGYSWRESVRRVHSKASHKFRSTLSRSVPDDLFQVGLKLAIFGGCQPNLSGGQHQSADGKAEVKAVTTQRCFSADPDLRDRQTICGAGKDSYAEGSNRPIAVQTPSPVRERAEDTVK